MAHRVGENFFSFFVEEPGVAVTVNDLYNFYCHYLFIYFYTVSPNMDWRDINTENKCETNRGKKWSKYLEHE